MQRVGRVHSPTDSRTNSLTLAAITHSASFSTSREVYTQTCSLWSYAMWIPSFQLSKPRSRSFAASLSPNLLGRFRRRSNNVSQRSALVIMPTVPPRRTGGLRYDIALTKRAALHCGAGSQGSATTAGLPAPLLSLLTLCSALEDL